MKKQQIVLVAGAVALLCVIYFFGRTIPPKKPVGANTTAQKEAFNIDTILAASKSKLTPEQQTHIAQLESAVVRGNVKEQQASVYQQLADYYRDSLHLLLPYAYYSAEAAKLENSEKSLTFAARFFLESSRAQREPGLKKWMAGEARQLFEKALVLNPGNDSLKVGLGSCFLFGNLSDNPMEGILMIREVAERDPSNMYAQYMLGIGGLMSGQLERAIDRLTLVANNQPGNVEAKLMLAEALERKGDKEHAAKWYESVKAYVNNPDILKELDDRIRLLRN